DVEVARTLPVLLQLRGEAAQELRTRVFRLVYPVPETGELVLALDGRVDELLDVLGRTDLLEHLHRPVGRAAVQRSLERTERRGHRGVHVGVRACDDARGERRCVQAVPGLNDEARVEDLGRPRVHFVETRHAREVRV